MERFFEYNMMDIVETADIGGTQMVSPWRSLRDFDIVNAKIVLGATITDPLTTFKLQQATTVAGAGVKDLTTSGTGAMYDSANLSHVAAAAVIIEARGEDLDVDNGFFWVRAIAAVAANTGVDNVTMVVTRSRPGYPAPHRDGAPSATQMYITRFGTVFA